jgi:hypothetical protein
MYPRENGEIIALPEEADAWDDVIVSGKADIKINEAQVREAENRMKAALGTATIGTLPGGGSYRFKNVNRTGYSVEPTSFRQLRRKV